MQIPTLKVTMIIRGPKKAKVGVGHNTAHDKPDLRRREE